MRAFTIKSFTIATILLMTFQGVATANNYDASKEVAVSLEDAEKVVETFIQTYSFPESIAQITSITPMYDINDVLIAYYYKFNEQYVLVSANKEYSPVLAASKGGSLEIAELNSSGKLYYLGGLSAAQALDSEEIINSDEDAKLKASSIRDEGLAKNPNADASWNHYLNNSAAKLEVSLTQKKLTMTTFNQYGAGVTNQPSACGPTTMAAISEYWRAYRGFSLIPSTYVYGSAANTINHFYNEHGGTVIGMWVDQMKAGLVLHNGDFYGSASASTITSYASYRTEINNNRPVAMKFDKKFTFFEPDQDYAYPYHWTVGKGYAYNSFDSMVIVNDNTGDSDHQEHFIDFPTNQPILSLVAFSM
ncbi:C39 family peptidase [Paenibacillus sp. FSL H8-0261]|uniref:C39 family peptidase n=1 Tax=Paenibacillus sp. FSL H8-0261 TaxID=2921381 RepID=UPI003245CDDF